MSPLKKTNKKKSGLKEYTYLGCPLTANRSPWCFRLCVPDQKGTGRCGRLAPHSLTGRTQHAIEHHKKKKFKQHLEKIKAMYMSAPVNRYYNPELTFEDKSVKLYFPFSKKFSDESGNAALSVLFKLLQDSAQLCIYSIEQVKRIHSSGFNVCYCRPSSSNALLARARYMGSSGDQLMAEAVVTSPDGTEIARGSGTFIISDENLTNHPKYKI